MACSEKLRSGEYAVKNVSVKGKGRGDTSPAWNKFGRVFVVATGEHTEFVQCMSTCKIIKIVKGNTGSTTQLANHRCQVPLPHTLPPPPRSSKGEVASILAELTAESFAPFTLVEAKAFVKLADYLIKLGHAHGPINASDVLPCARTVSTKLKATADEIRGQLAEEIRPAIEEAMASGTIDGWTDPQKCRKYLAHTVQYINSDWELQDNLIGIPSIDAESVTHEVIEEAIALEKSKLNLNPASKIHYVTDNGSDMVAAVAKSGNERSYCMDHCSNLIVRKSLEIQLTQTDLYGLRGGQIVFRVMSAVQYLMGCRDRALTKLKERLQRGPQRTTGQKVFKSSLPMLQAALANFDEVRKLKVCDTILMRGFILNKLTFYVFSADCYNSRG